MANRVKETTDISVQYPVHLGARNSNGQCIQRVILPALWPKTIRESEEVLFVYCVEYLHQCALDDFIFQCCDTQRALASIRFGNVLPS